MYIFERRFQQTSTSWYQAEIVGTNLPHSFAAPGNFVRGKSNTKSIKRSPTTFEINNMAAKDISHYAFFRPRVEAVDPLPDCLRATDEAAHGVFAKRRRHVPDSDDEDVPDSTSNQVLCEETQTYDEPEDDRHVSHYDAHRYASTSYEPDYPSVFDECDDDDDDLLSGLSDAELAYYLCDDVNPDLKVPLEFRFRNESGPVVDKGPNPYSVDNDVYLNSENTVDPKKGGRRWVFTVNHPSKNETKSLCEFLQQQSHYGIFECEIGESGTSHLQGYFHLTAQKTRTAIARLQPFKRAWLAIARGTEQQCQKYCSKGGVALEFHTDNFSPGAGARTDLHQAAAAIRDKGRAAIVELAMNDPMQYVRYHSGFEALARLTVQPRLLEVPPNVTVVLGESGSGKSTLVRQLCREAVVSKQAAGLPCGVYDWNHMSFPWFPEVKREDTILMCNDFRPVSKIGAIPMVLFCKKWDVDGCRLENKGGFSELQADTFFYSCIVHPKDWYADTAQEPIKQLLRRITRVIECYIEDGEFKQREIGNGEAPYGPPLFVMP